jgi:hypothetical protein
VLTGRPLSSTDTATAPEKIRPDGLVSAADTATVCGRPLLREAVAGPTSAGGMQPPSTRPGELAAEPVAELAAHVGHRRPLQRQGLLGCQPAQP